MKKFQLSSAVLTLILALIFTLSRSTPAQDVSALYETARKAEVTRDFKAALDAYEKILDIETEYRDTMKRWEICLELASWQKDLTGKPGAMDLVRLGEIFCKFKRYDEERAAYRDAINLDMHCADAHGHLAMSNYTSPGGSLLIVIRETTRFLETSPHRDCMEKVIADWAVFGKLRIYARVLRKELAEAAEFRKAGDMQKAAEILETAAARKEIPDAYLTCLFANAGELRLEGKDTHGAKKAFLEALNHPRCRATINARIGLAVLAVKAADLKGALVHLRAAATEGSGACRPIAALKTKALKPLFTSDDAEVREEMKTLIDPKAADEPIRAEIRAALERAKKEGKKVLLEWYGPYCPYVMAVEERMAHPDIRKILSENFVHVRMNQGSMHRGLTVDAEYGEVMRTHGVPSFFILNTDGRVHSVQKDAALMSVRNRAFGVDRIAAWLMRVAKE